MKRSLAQAADEGRNLIGVPPMYLRREDFGPAVNEDSCQLHSHSEVVL